MFDWKVIEHILELIPIQIRDNCSNEYFNYWKMCKWIIS